MSLVVSSSAIELLMQRFLLSLKLKETSSMLVLKAIGLGSKGLEIPLVLLEFAVRAIFFSSASSFYG